MGRVLGSFGGSGLGVSVSGLAEIVQLRGFVRENLAVSGTRLRVGIWAYSGCFVEGFAYSQREKSRSWRTADGKNVGFVMGVLEVFPWPR